jgi:UDP-N-acetylmuramyl tripeptide synthase
MNKLAILTGKLTAQAIRLSGAGLASNLPGRIARKVSRGVLGQLARQARNGVVAITGTNGKSTTSGLLSSILNTAGLDIVHNYQGANLVTGITACLVDAASWDGKIDTDYCIFEIDEAAFPLIAAEAEIHTVVVTNLFRDQLDRFGELDTTASLIEKGIKIKNSLSILNADDPNVSQLAPNSKRIYFGIAAIDEDTEEQKHRHKRNHSTADGTLVHSGHKEISNAELGYCGKCGEEVHYEKVYYGQLGRWACSNCENKRPQPDVYATNVRLFPDHSRFTMHLNGDELEIHLLIPGLFNVYNALAAATAAQSLNVTHESIRHGLKDYKTLFGRSEKVSIAGKEVFIQLIKNPAGTSQAVSAVVADEKSHVLIAINDNLADGRDISWLWDADFEQLGEKNRTVTVSGQRAEDMALRMKYAGMTADKISVVPSLSKALDDALAATPADHTLWLLPTYTCLLELQKILKARGVSLSKT